MLHELAMRLPPLAFAAVTGAVFLIIAWLADLGGMAVTSAVSAAMAGWLLFTADTIAFPVMRRSVRRSCA